MFKVGPNPYGLTCTLGLQGTSPNPRDLRWFVGLAEQMGGKCIEFHFEHLRMATAEILDEIRSRLTAVSIEPIISGPWPLPRLPEAFPIAKLLGVSTIRTHLTPVLCGARAAQGDAWNELVSGVQDNLSALGPRFEYEGLVLAIENHQDFGSEELLGFCEIGGPAVGICFDTGNPLAVGEAPIDFARKVAEKVVHLHMKDYQAQPTSEGYRLVRCAIGEGAIPFGALQVLLSGFHKELTASIEPGALEARHIRLLTPDWWFGYPSRPYEETQACLKAAELNAIPEGVDSRTPWEKGESMESICNFEMDQMTKSVQYMQKLKWLPQ